MVWPKPGYCQTLANESFWKRPWQAKWNDTMQYFHNYSGNHYRADNAPSYMSKIKSDTYEFEFHYIWKVASTSYPSYLWCEFYPLTRASSSDAVPDGYKVVASVRHPLHRFVSGVAEILQRSVNHYCPS